MTPPPPDSPAAPGILVVEDEEKTRQSIIEGFRMEGYTVKGAATGDSALRLLETEPFDLVVLDWMLPGRDGLEILKHARQRGIQTPVLMLTAREKLGDRVSGLESGADDYLLKPFAFAELLARGRALMRRPFLAGGRFLHCGDLQLDARARTAVRAGQQIPLTPREVDILEYLLRYQNQVVTRDMLERDVWKETRRLTPLDNVIDVQMMRLRRKVDPEGAERLIHTIKGVGYRLGKDPE